MSHTAQPTSVIEIKASYFVLAFILEAFCKPKASIDGGPAFDVVWGTTPIVGRPVATRSRCGCPTCSPERTQRHRRRRAAGRRRPGRLGAAPWLVFLKGAISVGPAQGAPVVLTRAPWAVAPPPASPGGWHADPAGRHEQRYYDGQAWTEHVVDAGVQSTDPLGS